jgi:hypothetical protein
MTDRQEPWRTILILRWIARVWSILVSALALMMAFSPDPYQVAPVPLEDWFLLSLWGAAVVGLLIAWRWELVGALLTLGLLLFRELAWVILKGPWLVNFLLVWLILATPAVLYLLAWRGSRQVTAAQTGQ